jgi:hypothetical protein
MKLQRCEGCPDNIATVRVWVIAIRSEKLIEERLCLCEGCRRTCDACGVLVPGAEVEVL